MNNLSNQIVHLSKILEKQIPKGYHEIVVEYVRQNIAGALYDLLAMVVCSFIFYLIARTLVHTVNNKDSSPFFENSNLADPEINGLGLIAIPITAIIGVIISIIFIAAFLDIQTAIQHAVAPNYYLIKSFIK